jgi:hypothetical protein
VIIQYYEKSGKRKKLLKKPTGPWVRKKVNPSFGKLIKLFLTLPPKTTKLNTCGTICLPRKRGKSGPNLTHQLMEYVRKETKCMFHQCH